MDITSYLLGLLPAIITGVTAFYIERGQKRRDEQAQEQQKMKEDREHLEINLLVASAKLSYAVAVAVKRGKPNGEIEEGIEQYNKAMEEFRKFEREQISKL